MAKVERFFTATLHLTSPLHIGEGKGGSPLDAPLRRSGTGRLFLPGRALGGSLRTLATRLAPRLGEEPCNALKRDELGPEPCGCIVCDLFGDLSPGEEEALLPTAERPRKEGNASRLWIADAFLSDGQAAIVATHARDGVGIDRQLGSAARNIKYDYEIVPAGSVFAFQLRLEEAEEATTALRHARLLVAALSEWEAGRGYVGGMSGRGLGQIILKGLLTRSPKRLADARLLDYLKADTPTERAAFVEPDTEWSADYRQAARQARVASPLHEPEVPAAGSFLEIGFELGMEGPFLVHDPLVGKLSGFNHAPQVEIALTATQQAGRPILPGASLRGALRSRAERIARTLATLHWKEQASFLRNCPACDPSARGEEAALASCQTRLTTDELSETAQAELCLACQLFGSARRGSRLRVSDGTWVGADPAEKSWHAQDFLAIDRFTGGGRDQAKFDAAPLSAARFRASLILDAPQPWEVGWLALLLRDLAEGEITLGFGAAKGYGQARAKGVVWRWSILHESDWLPLSTGAEIEESGMYDRYSWPVAAGAWLPDGWLEMAQGWLGQLQDKLRTSRDKPFPEFTKDSYFGTAMATLYGLPRLAEVTHG